MVKTTSKRPSRGGRGGPPGIVAWTLWLIVIALLAVIARYAYIAAQPDRTGYTLFGRKGSLAPVGRPRVDAGEKPSVGGASHKPAKDYSTADRAKLDRLVNEVASTRR